MPERLSELGCHRAALQCTNQPPDFGGGLYQPVTVLYADKPYIIATQQDGTDPTSYGVVGSRFLCLVQIKPPQIRCEHGTDAHSAAEPRPLEGSNQPLASILDWPPAIPHSPLQAALFSLEGSGLAQRSASGAFSNVNSASCSNFVWLRSGSAADADAEDPRLATSCFLKGPGRTVVSRLRRFAM